MDRTTITRTVSNLHTLFRDSQLVLQPEFQRNSVWPRRAKAYFIDTLLNNLPVPLFYFQRARSPQTGKITFYVVDGQQRLRAIFEYLDGSFPLLETEGRLRKRFYSELPAQAQQSILSYELAIQELIDYSDKAIRDIFKRMNKYVVKANPQEIRHATKPGIFADFVDDVANLAFWREHDIFTPTQRRRMRHQELCAELAILVIEGPQDKKASVDLYYDVYSETFKERKATMGKIRRHLAWIATHIPHVEDTFLRKPIDFYSLVGALSELSVSGRRAVVRRLADRIRDFQTHLDSRFPRGIVADYVEAASRQTDNLRPRRIRIDIIKKLLLNQL